MRSAMAAAPHRRNGSTDSPTPSGRATTRRRPGTPTATTRWSTTPPASRSEEAVLGSSSAPLLLFLLALLVLLLGRLGRALVLVFPLLALLLVFRRGDRRA